MKEKNLEDCLEYTLRSVQIRRCLNVDIWGPYSTDHHHHLYCLLVTGRKEEERGGERKVMVSLVLVQERDEMTESGSIRTYGRAFPAAPDGRTPLLVHSASGWFRAERKGRKSEREKSINQ